MTDYNGHRNRTNWNVALWIGNDESLYHMARDHIRRCKTKDEAARVMFEALKECGVTHTPDGSPYSVSAIRAAMVGLG